MGHRLRRRPLATDLHFQGIVQRPARELLQFRRQRGGEKQGLSVLRTFLHDALHVGQKAHVQHPVHFVEHENVHVGQRHVALFHVVEEPARRRRQNIHPALQVVQLLPVTDAAIHDRHAEISELGKFLKRFLHLQRQLARRLKNQAAQLSVRTEALDNRQRKRRRLARARLRRTDDVPTLQHHRNRLRLNRRRRHIAHFLHAERQRIRQAQRRKSRVHLGHIHRHRRLDRRRARMVKRLVDDRTFALAPRPTARGTATPT